MVANTPNSERIDSFETRISERFDFHRLEDWPLDRLHEARWLVEIEVEMFEATFPAPESSIQGQTRAYVLDDPNDRRKALTDEEWMRLRHIKRTALGEIYRAEGKRKDELREHRLKLYNTAVDFVSAVGSTLRSVLP